MVAVSEHGYAHKTAADAVGISDGTLGGWVRLDDGRDDLVADWICEAGLRRIHRWRDKEDHSLLPNN